jgi:hypothetical protein
MTTIQCVNEVNGRRHTVRVPSGHIETVARLQAALEVYADDYDILGDLAAVYAVADRRRIVVTLYGSDTESALARWQEVLSQVRGRAQA